MRHLLTAVLVAGLLTGPLSRESSAVSVEDLFNLQANGLSDDVLVALIQTDGSSFRLSAADVIALYKRGLSEKVILAMVESGRLAAAREAAATAAPAPSEDRSSQVRPVVNVHQTVTQHVDTRPSTVIVQVPVAVPVVTPVVTRPPEPVYWGYGGNLRPDAWRPAPTPDPHPAPAEERKTPETAPASKRR